MSAVPRLAATVVLTREQPNTLEVYLVKRSQRSGFWPSAHVFPGGRVDDEDGGSSAMAAIRECYEECGVLLASQQGRSIDMTMHAEVSTKTSAGDGLWPTLAGLGLQPDVASLLTLTRWITPNAESKRYDTQFFAARVPTLQRDLAGADGHEVTSGLWTTASNALEMTLRGDMVLAPPTVATLEDIADCRTWSSLQTLHWPTTPIEPVMVQQSDRVIIALPGDPEHSDAKCIFGARTRLESIARGPFRSAWIRTQIWSDPK